MTHQMRILLKVKTAENGVKSITIAAHSLIDGFGFH